jgi:HK97 family phage major capsid protein
MRVCSACGVSFSGRFCPGCGHDEGNAPVPGADQGREVVELVRSRVRTWDDRIGQLERQVLGAQRLPMVGGGNLDRAGFTNLGEFFATARFAPHDGRLTALSPMGERALSMGTGAAGGFLVPAQFSAELLSMAAALAIVRPRARVIGGGEPSDAEIELPTLDTSGTKGRLGGVQVHWTGEAGLKQDTQPAFAQVKLKPSEVSAMVTASDRLLRNAQAATEVISFLLAEAIRAEEDACFVAGNGVGKPLGFLGHPCSIEIARGTPGHIVFADIANMLMAARAGRPYVWLGSRTCLADLMNLTLTGGAGGTAQPIWLPSAREGLPSTLMGLPFLEPEGAPTLGNLGDLCLCDFGFYLIRDGFGMEIRTSDSHADNFSHNSTSIRCSWTVDGQPWLSTPLRRADGTDCSPFVVLS